jgi:hypothetical protein
MSRILVTLTLVLLLIASVSVAGDNAKTTELGWFDMQHCDMCKNMSPELMSSMSWAQYPIDNGVLSVTTVKESALPAYQKAHMDMAACQKKIQAGEAVTLCGSCTALTNCMMKGAHYEDVQTKNGDIAVITSDDPKVVAELHAWAEKNKAEMAKMMKKEEKMKEKS